MRDPLDQAAATLPETLGQGCLQRYDLEQLHGDSGATFEGAAELWARQHSAEGAWAVEREPIAEAASEHLSESVAGPPPKP